MNVIKVISLNNIEDTLQFPFGYPFPRGLHTFYSK